MQWPVPIWLKIALSLLWLAGLGFALSFLAPAAYEICGPDQYTGAKQCSAYHFGPYVLMWTAGQADGHNGLLTAIFTGVLTVFTIGLWHETRRLSDGAKEQAIENQKSLEAAQKAANAADLSAKAAIGVELPFLYVEKLEFDRPFPTAEGYEQWCKSTSPIIKIKNFGRTPAFVSSVVINCKMSPLPSTPTYEIINKYPVGAVIDDRDTKEIIEYLFKAERFLAWEDIEAALAGKKFLYLYAQINFTDFLGTGHSCGAIWTYSSAAKAFTPSPIFPNYRTQT